MRILLIDDHPIFVEGLKLLLLELDGNLELDDACDLRKADSLLAENSYELVLLDLKLSNSCGLETLESFRESHYETPVVVLSGEDSPRIVKKSIDRGAMGFIPKSSTPDILINALRLVLANGIYLPPRILASDSEYDLGETSSLESLSKKQKEVLRYVIRGEPNKSIARELHMSESTVKAHLSSVLQILGARNRTEAVFIAARQGMNITL